jgi:hypothetical protein
VLVHPVSLVNQPLADCSVRLSEVSFGISSAPLLSNAALFSRKDIRTFLINNLAIIFS